MPKAQGTILWFYHYSPTLHAQRCNPSWSKNLYVQVPIAYIHPLRALSVSRAPVKATELSAVGFWVHQPSWRISWLHPCTQLASSYSDPEVKMAQICRCPTYHTKRVDLIRSLRRRPYRMKPTAVGFISLTTVRVEPPGPNLAKSRDSLADPIRAMVWRGQFPISSYIIGYEWILNI